MNDNTISSKLERIKDSTDRMRAKTGVVSGAIEDVASAVEGMDTINNQDKVITANGTYSAEEGYTGLGTINVNVPTGGSTEDLLLQYIDGHGDFDFLFYHYNGTSLDFIKDIDFSKATNMTQTFNTCFNLVTIPMIDTSNVTNMSYMFSNCQNLTSVPQLDTSKVTDMRYLFNACNKLTEIPFLNTSSVTNMESIFNSCSSLKTIPLLDTSHITSTSSMFYNCYKLETIPQIDTSNVLYTGNMFGNCYKLTTIPLLNAGKVIGISDIVYGCRALTTLGGFKDLGKGYDTAKNANYSSYKLNLSSSTSLTEQSLINVLNNLYDIASLGVKTQTVQLGSTNLAKLTSEAGQAARSSAQRKGWTIS